MEEGALYIKNPLPREEGALYIKSPLPREEGALYIKRAHFQGKKVHYLFFF
jgi:hypothetical protein